MGRITLRRLFAGAVTLLLSTGALAAASGSPATARALPAYPAFQLPFTCGQTWQLNSWAHSPALDMVREPDQHGTEGAAVRAPLAGRVNQSFFHSNAGNTIQINHGGGWFTTYLHLQSRSVAVGANVSQGQIIGYVGKTGPTANNHPHLHFETAYDANGNGSATWGADNTERVPSVFNGVKYGTADGQQYDNVRSNNTCGGTNPSPSKYFVDTFADAPGYSTPGGTRTGTLWAAASNYVFCKVWGPKVGSSTVYNHWWLRTDLDEGNPWQNQYVSAYYLRLWGNDEAKDNNGAVIRDC
jgi:hypothetical protein